MNRKLILATVVVVASAAQAQAFNTRNGFRANQVNNAVFEVVPRTENRQDEIWCAAADYARRGLKAGWQTRMYVARGYGPSETTGRKTAVQFTLDPQAAGVTPMEGGGVKSGFKVGDSMSIQQANGRCNLFPRRF